MTKAKLRATRIPDTKLILGATTTLNALKQNAAQFSGAAEMIAQLEAVLAPFTDATRALANAKMELKRCASVKNTQRKSMERAWARVAGRVESQSYPNTSLLQVAGLPVTNDPRPVYMTKVLNLQLLPSRNEGEIFARWKPVRRARAYEVEICLDKDMAPTNWIFHSMSTKARCRLNHSLVSGQKVWVRVRAGSPRGPGAWSNLARLTVP